MSSTLLTIPSSISHIISAELEIPLTVVTVQSSVSESPIFNPSNLSFPSVSLSNMVSCIKGVGTIKRYSQAL